MRNKASLLLKLTVDKDLRTVEKQQIQGGRINHFFEVVKLKFYEMVKVELVFLLFALPLLALIIGYYPILKAEAISKFNFTNYMGIGYATGIDSPVMGIVAKYNVMKKIMLFFTPGLLIVGFGAAGMFYCSRGYMWGEPVVVSKAFFRGIKKLWKYFVPVFTAVGVIATAIGYAILDNMIKIQLHTANFLSYFLMIIAIIFGLATVMVCMFLMPMFACYNFKFKDYLKNSVLLNILMFRVSILMAVVTVLPFMLFKPSGQLSMLILFVFLGIGFVFIAMMWTAFAQNSFDIMIGGMYEARQESERKKAEKALKKPEKVEFVNPKKKGKKNPPKQSK